VLYHLTNDIPSWIVALLPSWEQFGFEPGITNSEIAIRT
jgi:hypothetical protein